MKTKSFTSRSFAVLLTTILLLVAIPVTTVFAANTAATNAGTGANVNGPGTQAWTNASNITDFTKHYN
jgi:hypothetical protein